MKLPRLITRRRAKWVGTLLSMLIVVGLALSVFVRVHVIRSVAGGQPYVRVDLFAGGIQAFWWNWPLKRERYRPTDGWEWNAEAETSWMPWQSPGVKPGLGLVFVPLWLPLLLIAAPTAWLWRTDRRAKPWQCAKCRYDLRGLDGGVCPECGHELKPSNAEGVTG